MSRAYRVFCDWIAFFVLVAVFIAVVGTFLAVPVIANWWSCSRKAAVMERDYKFGLGYGCMVKTKSGAWVPLRAIREVAE